MIDNYYTSLGFQYNPFSITPDPTCFYLSQDHENALAHLKHGISQNNGFVLLTGEVGTGKTTLCRKILENLPDNIEIAYIYNPRLSTIELLANICDELQIDYDETVASIKDFTQCINQYLLDQHALGKRVILLIDEAQNLSMEVLEQTRLLSNLETNKNKLLQIILVGQPELKRLLDLPQLRQLNQRITARYHLNHLSRVETKHYIRHRVCSELVTDTDIDVDHEAGIKHRCHLNDYRQELFPTLACWVIYHYSKGIPRIINVICDHALMGLYSQNKAKVSYAIAKKAAEEATGIYGKTHPSLLHWFATTLLILLVFPWFFPQYLPWLPQQSLELSLPHLEPKSDVMKQTQATTNASLVLPTKTVAKNTVTVEDLKPSQTDFFTWLQTTTTSKQQALMILADVWQLSQQAPICVEASGYFCPQQKGNWNTLRQLNLPVILLLKPTLDTTYYLVIKHIAKEQVTLLYQNQEYLYDMTEISPYWLGDFIFLWVLPEFPLLPLKQGMQGDSVVWLRQCLAQFYPQSFASSSNPRFDQELKQQVMHFQASYQLQADGIVGKNTLLYLSHCINDFNVPKLSNNHVLHP